MVIFGNITQYCVSLKCHKNDYKPLKRIFKTFFYFYFLLPLHCLWDKAWKQYNRDDMNWSLTFRLLQLYGVTKRKKWGQSPRVPSILEKGTGWIISIDLYSIFRTIIPTLCLFWECAGFIESETFCTAVYFSQEQKIIFSNPK